MGGSAKRLESEGTEIHSRCRCASRAPSSRQKYESSTPSPTSLSRSMPAQPGRMWSGASIRWKMHSMRSSEVK